MKFAIFLTFLIMTLSACGPSGGSQVNAPRVPKGTAEPNGGAPDIGLTRLSEAATQGTAEPLVQRTPLPTWPPPFTYSQKVPLPTEVPRPAIPFLFPPDTTNILLVGSDRRPNSQSFRTDVLIVLSIQPGNEGAALLSIPRDLYVYIPGFTMQRINAAYVRGESGRYPGGGPALLADTILYNLGIQINHIAQVEMTGFQRIIDTLDGVDVSVTCSYTDWRLRNPELDPEDEDNWLLFTVPRGVVHMNGDYALWYARSRQRSSDFDRSRRQQEVLRAAYREILRLGLIPRLPDLYNDLSQSVSTDLSLGDLLRLAPNAARIDSSRIRSRFIGREAVRSWRTPTGGQVMLPVADRVEAIVNDAFDFSNEIDQEGPRATIEVINASSQEGWEELAVERLVYAGFSAQAGAPQSETRATTTLVDFGFAPEGTAADALRAIGLSPSRLTEDTEVLSRFDMSLVIGNDYQPCFDPTTN